MSISKVKIKISSSVKNEGDSTPERSEESTEGFMRCSEDGTLLRLSYKTEYDGIKTETVLEPYGSVLRIERSGALESIMLFEVGVIHTSLYKIPPYAFDMSVLARRTEISVGGEGGKIILEYDMEIGGAKKSCLMTLLIAK